MANQSSDDQKVKSQHVEVEELDDAALEAASGGGGDIDLAEGETVNNGCNFVAGCT